MHNRSIIDGALAAVGMSSPPAIETNSLLAVTLAVSAGDVCAILPGAMVVAVRGKADLEALPLVEPDIRTPVGFIALMNDRPSRAVQAALRLMDTPEWAQTRERHAGETAI
jgi:DNA-binding transcriptional LysR family regulator